MKLNDRQIKNAKPAEKPFKLNDGKGLYLYETFAITYVTKILCSISFSKCKTFLIFPTFCSILGRF